MPGSQLQQTSQNNHLTVIRSNHIQHFTQEAQSEVHNALRSATAHLQGIGAIASRAIDNGESTDMDLEAIAIIASEISGDIVEITSFLSGLKTAK